MKAILLAGAPRTAGGEEEELMLRATRAIIERPGPLPLRIGVNTGRVFAGIVGTLTRRTYTFYGDAINTAARIMARAARRPAARARGRPRTRAHDLRRDADRAVRAKGKAELVRASDVGAAVGEREPEAIGPFVGREAELDALLAALAAAAGEGRARSRSSRAAPGVGKTRLLGELCAQAAGARTLRVQCAQTRASTIRMPPPERSCGARCSSMPTPRAREVERRLRAVVRERARALEPWLPLLGLVVGLEPAADARERRARGARSSPSASRRASRRCSWPSSPTRR